MKIKGEGSKRGKREGEKEKEFFIRHFLTAVTAAPTDYGKSWFWSNTQHAHLSSCHYEQQSVTVVASVHICVVFSSALHAVK